MDIKEKTILIITLLLSLFLSTNYCISDTYVLDNANLKLDIEYPSVEANSLSFLVNVDGPITPLNRMYAIIHGRSQDGVVGSWQARILNDGFDFKIYDYLNNGGPIWSTKFYTRDYPFCFFAKDNTIESSDDRYRVFTQRETDFPQINRDNVPTYSQIGIFKASRVNSKYANQVGVISPWQDVSQCCYIDASNPSQLPAGIKGDILVHVEPIDKSTALIYYTRIIDTRQHNYNHSFDHGYPTYLNPKIEPPEFGSNDWHRPNLCVAEFDINTNKVTKYYNGQFEVNQVYDSGLLDRPAMYGRMINYNGTLIYISQSYGNVGFHIFTSKNYIDWVYECTIPIENAFHPMITKLDEEDSFMFYFCKDRDKKYTFGLRSVKVNISEISKVTETFSIKASEASGYIYTTSDLIGSVSGDIKYTIE